MNTARARTLEEQAKRPDDRDDENWYTAVAEFEMMAQTTASAEGASFAVSSEADDRAEMSSAEPMAA